MSFVSTALRPLVPLVAAALVVPPLSVAVSPAAAVPAAGEAAPDDPTYREYVALGDSFSAGPLVPLQRADNLGCLRSTNNYPAFLASYLSPDTFTDVTCSGAETTDMRERQKTIVPGPAPAPQLDALTANTDLVTLGIGGNDFGLFGSMISTCEEVREQDPAGAPCRDHFTVDGVDIKKRDARRIQARVGRVVREIRARAPQADVFVVGYPRLLPERGTCTAVPFAKGDYRWGNVVERLLNRSIRRAAVRNGAEYVDLYPASKGHDACAGDDAWINGSKLKPLRAANFHPFLVGMRGISKVVHRRVTGRSAPDLRLATSVAGPQVAPIDAEQLAFLGALLAEQLTP